MSFNENIVKALGINQTQFSPVQVGAFLDNQQIILLESVNQLEQCGG
jgi:hypothetical protein